MKSTTTTICAVILLGASLPLTGWTQNLPDKPALSSGAPNGVSPKEDDLDDATRKKLADKAMKEFKQQATPEMTAQFHGMMVERIRKEYAPLLKKWNLPPADLEAVAGLISEMDLGPVDYAMSHPDAASLDFEKLESMVKKAKEEASKKLKSILGAERFEELTAFKGELKIVGVVDPSSKYLKGAGFPLTQEQRIKLANVLSTTERKPLTPDAHNQTPAGLFTDESLRKRNEEQQALILQKAKAFLTPDQIGALQAFFRDENKKTEAAGKMIEEMLKSADDAVRKEKQKDQ